MDMKKPPIFDVLFYEPNGARERIHVVRDAYELLEPANDHFRRLIRAFKDTNYDVGADTIENRRRAVWTILNEGATFPQAREILEETIAQIPKDQRFFLTTSPYENVGHIPEDFDELKQAYEIFFEEFQKLGGRDKSDPSKIGMFVFNAYQGNGQLEEIMRKIDTDFPLLKQAYWLACRNEKEPLSRTIVDRLREDKENRRLLIYTPENASTVAEEIARRVVKYPAYKKPKRKRESRRLETGMYFAPFEDQALDEYTDKLQTEVMTQGLDPKSIDLIVAMFKLKNKCLENDPRLLRLRSVLRKKFEQLKGDITEV